MYSLCPPLLFQSHPWRRPYINNKDGLEIQWFFFFNALKVATHIGPNAAHKRSHPKGKPMMDGARIPLTPPQALSSCSHLALFTFGTMKATGEEIKKTEFHPVYNICGTP